MELSKLVEWSLQDANWLVYPIIYGLLYVLATGLGVHAKTLGRPPSGDHP